MGEGVLAAGQVVVAVGGVQEVGPVAALGVVTAALLALRRAAGHDVPNLLRRCQYIAIVSTKYHTRFVCTRGQEASWNTLHGS